MNMTVTDFICGIFRLLNENLMYWLFACGFVFLAVAVTTWLFMGSIALGKCFFKGTNQRLFGLGCCCCAVACIELVFGLIRDDSAILEWIPLLFLPGGFLVGVSGNRVIAKKTN